MTNVVSVGFVYAWMGNVRGTRGVLEGCPSYFQVHRHLWLGFKGLAGSFLVLFLPSFVFFSAWTDGWVFSFERVRGLHLVVGFWSGVLSMLLYTPLLAYLPIAQVEFARTGRISAFFRLSSNLALVRVRPWGNLAWAFVTPLFVLEWAHARYLLVELGGGPAYQILANVTVGVTYLAVRLAWARRTAHLAALADDSRTPDARARTAAGLLLLAPAIATTGVTVMLIFRVSFGWGDFFAHPLFQIPSVPYWAGPLRPSPLP